MKRELSWQFEVILEGQTADELERVADDLEAAVRRVIETSEGAFEVRLVVVTRKRGQS